MEFSITLSVLKTAGLKIEQAFLLYMLYYKKFEDIAETVGKKEALVIRNSLVDSKYLLSDSTVKFTETVISKKNVERLFGIRSDQVNFWEFYSCYPIKVGTRILRASSNSAALAKKHEDKYLKRVKTVEQHEKAILALEAYLSKQRQSNSMKFLPMMETVMNNSLWESWEVFIDEVGKEGLDWNSSSI